MVQQLPTTLSKLVANWLYTFPGALFAETEEDVIDVAKQMICEHYNFNLALVDSDALKNVFRLLGYIPVPRKNHGPTVDRPLTDYWCLALPERSRSF